MQRGPSWTRIAVIAAIPAAVIPVVLTVHAPPAGTLIWPLFVARPVVWVLGLACTALAFFALHRSRPDERLGPIAAFLAFLSWGVCQGCLGLGLFLDGPRAETRRSAGGHRWGVVHGYVEDSIPGEFVYDCGRLGIVCSLCSRRSDFVGTGAEPGCGP